MVISLDIKKYLNSLFIRTFIALILLFLCSYLLRYNYYYDEIYASVHTDVLDFSYIKSKTRFFIGHILGKRNAFVSSNTLQYKEIKKAFNGVKLTTDRHYVVNALKSGTVIFIGNKENLGNTIIIEGEDGVNIWYSNLENISIHLYDYVEASSILGSTIEDYLYITLTKDDDYLDYEEYL